LVACGGAFLILAGVCLQILQLVVSIRTWRERRDLTGDPWDGRTLEWSLSSPPPAFNFPLLPAVEGLDAYWTSKSAGPSPRRPAYEDIWLPANSPVGFCLAACASVGGFALVWHIWWLVALGLVGAIGALIASSWREHGEVCIPADEVARLDHLTNVFRVRN
jgi:cytochrome o ubiquinol oxidase subunit 1